MSLLDILNHRRAVRHYDADKPIDKEVVRNLLLSGKTQITYKSLRNSLYIGNSAFFFEIQAPLIK